MELAMCLQLTVDRMSKLEMLLLVVLVKLFTGSGLYAQENRLAYGTIIITLISEDTIWLGADSRTSSLTDIGYTVNEQGMCKINSTNNIVYAMAGHVRYVDNSFNFLELMQKCITQQEGFEGAMKLFQQKTETEIRSILKKFSRASINTLVRTNQGSFLTVVAISFVNGEKKMKEMRFSIQSKGTNKWEVLYKENEENIVGTLRFFGHAANASEYVRDNQLFFGNGRNIPDKITELIQLEATKGAGTVGMPADVMSIYNNGYKKVITSGLCP
jgi:hypothetical protein